MRNEYGAGGGGGGGMAGAVVAAMARGGGRGMARGGGRGMGGGGGCGMGPGGGMGGGRGTGIGSGAGRVPVPDARREATLPPLHTKRAASGGRPPRDLRRGSGKRPCWTPRCARGAACASMPAPWARSAWKRPWPSWMPRRGGAGSAPRPASEGAIRLRDEPWWLGICGESHERSKAEALSMVRSLRARLGRSLGVDLIPYKTCTFDCIYRQLGRTTPRPSPREPFVPIEAILAEVRRRLDSGGRPDYMSLAALASPPCIPASGT